jgi:hypothetical protein
MIALEGDIGGAFRGVAVEQRHAFRIALPIVGERLAFLAEERADGCRAQAFDRPSVMVDSCPKPGSGIGDCGQRIARGVDGERRAAKVGGLAERLTPPRQTSLPNSLCSGLSRSKSMGIAVIATGSAWLSTLAGLSARAGATTSIAAAAMATFKGLRQTLNQRNAMPAR